MDTEETRVKEERSEPRAAISSPLDEVLEVHRRAAELIEGLTEDVLALSVRGAGTVGAQLRHCLEFPARLVDGFGPGEIDYDRRVRNERLERDPAALRKAFARVEERLCRLAAEDLDAEIRVRHDVRPDREGEWSRSTLGRELRFVCSHGIHHLALVALLLRTHGLEPDEELGVAPSTLAHRRRDASPCAR